MDKSSQSFRVFLSNGLTGIISILLAVLLLLHRSGAFFNGAAVVVTILFIFSDISHRTRWERFDERAREHDLLAVRSSFAFFVPVLMFSAGIFTVMPVSCRIVIPLLFIAGCQELTYTVLFILFEKHDSVSSCLDDDPPESSL